MAATAGISATKTYGKRSFKVAANKTKKVKVPLSKAGKRLLRKRKSAKVWANLKIGGKKSSAGQVKLRRR